MGTAILDDADDEITTPTYTPKDTAGNSDVGSYLRVVATYTDGRDDGKTATAVSQYMTIDDIADNTAPEFPAASTTRSVREELPKGTLVGEPVTATDADSGEKLTYWLSGTEADDERVRHRPDYRPIEGQDQTESRECDTTGLIPRINAQRQCMHSHRFCVRLIRRGCYCHCSCHWHGRDHGGHHRRRRGRKTDFSHGEMDNRTR